MDNPTCSVLVLAMCAAAGCKDGSGAGAADAGSELDAGSSDAMVEENFCTVLEASYGDLGAVTGQALVQPADELDPTGYRLLSLSIDLSTDPSPDRLYIELWEDEVGPFQQGFVATEISLSGGQADLFSCTACAYVAADVIDPLALDYHMASRGALSIDVIDATPGTGSVLGTLSNARFRRVTVDEEGQHEVVDACVTEIDSMSFDFSVIALEGP